MKKLDGLRSVKVELRVSTKAVDDAAHSNTNVYPLKQLQKCRVWPEVKGALIKND